MRIRMVAIGSTGDVQPMIVLGKELKRRGHSVSLTAFGTHRAAIEGAGLGFFSLPGDAEHYIKTLIKPGANPFSYLTRLEQALGGAITPLLDAIYEACHGADAVISTFFGSAVYAMADALDVPLFETNYCLTDETGDYCLPVMRQPPLGRAFNRGTYKLAYRMIGALEKRYVKPWCEANGIAPRDISHGPNYRMGQHVVPVLYAFSERVIPRPHGWAENLHIVGFWGERDTGCTPSAALQKFLAQGPTPVYIGFGSMNSGSMAYVRKALLVALENTNQRAILSAGWGKLDAGSMADSVHVLDEYVPHPWLFEQVRAVVHHGGAGTTAAGLMAGKPTLIIPFGSDQFFWGNRVHALGCGPKPLPRTALTGKRFTAVLNQLVSTPAYLDNAEHIHQSLLKEDGAAMAADLIEAKLQKRQEEAHSP